MNALTLMFLVSIHGISTALQEENMLRIACMSDDDCKADAPGTHCIDKQCTCSKISGCRQPEVSQIVRKIGENCRRASDCFVQDAVCNMEGKCACHNGTIASDNRKTCLLAATSLEQPCEENIQCSSAINSTECANGICSCVNGTRAISGECFHMKGLGEKCASDEECWNVKYSLCTRGRCTCVKKYVAGTSACLDVATRILASCSEDVQCTESLGKGAECVETFCDCKELYQYKFSTKKCVRDKLLGEECADHHDCHQPGKDPSRLECILGECKCRKPYYQMQGYCVEGASDAKKSSSFLIASVIIILCLF